MGLGCGRGVLLGSGVGSRRRRVGVGVASLVAGGTFHLELDGADVSGPVRVPATGGWSAWRTLALPDLELSAGGHSLRLVLDTNGDSPAVGNFASIELTASDRQAVSLPIVSR